ncbi:MAG: cytochrome c oxidase assembly protein [Phycisphaeraceae bacterium]
MVIFQANGAALAHAAGFDQDAVTVWWQAWSWQPLPLLGTLLAASIYSVGLTRLWRHVGIGRGVGRWQAGCFGVGVVALLLALISPIDTLAAHLGWVHMIQHTLLMLVAAPLLVAGSPALVSLWAMPRRSSRPLGRSLVRLRLPTASRYLLWQPLAVWLLFTLMLWLWHLPKLYDLALRNQFVHDVQHLAFLLGACLYWRVVVDPLGRVRLTAPLAVVYLFTMSLQGMFLGVFMALSPRLWYQHYADTTDAWGLAPLTDQQIAGYIMWMPSCAIYAVVAVFIFGSWLHRSAEAEHAE